MSTPKQTPLPTHVVVAGLFEHQEVSFTFDAPSIAQAHVAARYLVKRLDQPFNQNEQRDDHICPIHGVQMTRHEKDGSHWYSHKLDDGSWCRGRAK